MNRTSHWAAFIGLGLLVTACGGSGSSGSTALVAAATPGAAEPQQAEETGQAVQLAATARMFIDIEGAAEVVDKDEYLTATVRIESDIESDRLEVQTDIRGRGNATWTMPKKPYRLRLKSPSPVLGMPAERDWALLANYADKTLARTEVAMTLGERMGMTWTPRSRFVELTVNGEYRGVYQVFEHVKTGPDRADIGPEIDETDVDPDAISGGWFLEVDRGRGEDVCWETNSSIVICVKEPGLALEDVSDPSNPAAAQLSYIRNYVNEAERELHIPGGEGWRAYFDVPAAIDWYLVNEIMRNHDARLISSTYLQKKRGGPLVFGPLWDFDIAGGNFDYADAEQPIGWWVRDSVWHSRMFERPSFRQEVFQRWCELKRENVTVGLGGLVDDVAARIGPEPVARNFARWPILGVNMPPFYYTGATTYQGEIDHLKGWLEQRVTWMDGEYRNEFGECTA